MRRALGITAVTSILAAYVAAAGPAFGADSGSVALTVTAATPCITVAPTAPVDLGTARFSTTTNPASLQSSSPISFRNCGTTNVDVFMRGTDATGPTAVWALQDNESCSAGPNNYFLAVGATFFVSKANRPAPKNAAGENTYSPDESMEYTPLLQMPCTGSDGAGEQMSLEIVFTATL